MYKSHTQIHKKNIMKGIRTKETHDYCCAYKEDTGVI